MVDERYLLDLMRRESSAAKGLLDLLILEEQAIAERDAEAIRRFAADKQASLDELEMSAAERQRLLSAAGLGAGRAGFEELLQRVAGEASQLHAVWEGMRQDLAACQEQNLKNGRILEASRRVAGDLLSILLGERENTELYGRDGTTNRSRGNHTYAKV